MYVWNGIEELEKQQNGLMFNGSLVVELGSRAPSIMACSKPRYFNRLWLRSGECPDIGARHA